MSTRVTCACGDYTWSRTGTCRDCRRKPAAVTDDSSDALEGGYWKPGKHGILHWVQVEEVPAKMPEDPHQGACAKGHEWTPENTRIAVDKNGKTRRRCRECNRQHNRANEAKRKAQRAATPLRCEECRVEMPRRTGRGQQAKFCEPCRKERRADSWRKSTEKAKAAA